jgi:CBS domain-containing protein
VDRAQAYESAPNQPLTRLSDLLGRAVFLGDEKAGKLEDLVIVDKERVAEVTHISVARPFGRPAWCVPWSQVADLSDARIVLHGDRKTEFPEAAPAKSIMLVDFILDKKVLDVEGRELEVVYDAILARQNGQLYVVGVDLSRRALLRRIGLRWLARLTEGITDRIEKDIVDWNLVEPLPEDLGSFSGDIRLKVVKDELAKMPVVDVARILEQLGEQQRSTLFSQLVPAVASDTLEELDPKSQRELINTMPPDEAARLINAMTPGQAADVLAVLHSADMREILRLLDPEKRKKVRGILENQEHRAGDFVSTDFIKLAADNTIAQARQRLQAARERDAVAYLYVLDARDQLQGIIDTTDLLTRPDDTPLSQIMKSATVTINADASLHEAEELFERYRFRAFPVVDADGRMQGIILYRDVMDLEH